MSGPVEHHDVEIHDHPTGPYYWVFGTLAVLTILTVLASYVHLGHAGNIAIGLLIAVTKATLVAAIFMHLKFEPRAILWVFLCTLPLFAIMMLFIFQDASVLYF